MTSEPSLPDASSDEVKATAILKDRETMGHWASKKIEQDELRKYQAEWNAHSLDGLTGLRVAGHDRGERLWVVTIRAWARRIAEQREALFLGIVLGSMMVILPLLVT